MSQFPLRRGGSPGRPAPDPGQPDVL